MMNPLYRRMFQQPGASRQPMGILASSPELANVAAQRQPVRMNQGGMNTTTFTAAVQRAIQAGDRYALQELADPNNYGEAAKTQDGQNAIKMATQAINRAASNNPPTQISTSDTVAAPGGNTVSLTSPPVMSVRGSGDTVKLKAAPPMMSYDGPSEGALQRRDALSNAPSKIMEGLSSGFDKVGIGLTDVGQKISDAFTFSPSPGVGTYRSPKDKQADVRNRLSKVFGFRGLLRPEEEIRDFEANITPSQSTFDDDVETTTDFEGGVATGLPLTSAEELAASKTTPTQSGAEKDAAKETNKSKYEVVESSPKLLTPENITLIGSETPEGNDLTLKVGETLTEAGKNISTGDLGLSSTEDLVNSIFGVEDAVAAKTGKKATKKERVAAEMEILKEFFGEKAAKDIRTDFNYNLMMTGLLIAAGESPNAGTNIAKGLAAGLKTYGDATGEAAKQENELQQALGLQAYKNVTDEISAEKLSAAQEKDTKIRVSADIATANMNNNAAAQRLSAQLGNNRDQWKAQLEQADSQFDATMELKNKELNMPSAEIKTLKALMKQPELIEVMQKAAAAKDPDATYSTILGYMLKSPIMMMQFQKEDGSFDMDKASAVARAGAAMAPSLVIQAAAGEIVETKLDVGPLGATYSGPETGGQETVWDVGKQKYVLKP